MKKLSESGPRCHKQDQSTCQNRHTYPDGQWLPRDASPGLLPPFEVFLKVLPGGLSLNWHQLCLRPSSTGESLKGCLEMQQGLQKHFNYEKARSLDSASVWLHWSQRRRRSYRQ